MARNSITDSLYLIDLDQDLTGFRKFISSWVYVGKSVTFVVDPGPSHTADLLISELEKIPIPTLDYILLTHIHIDHAGGTGKLLERYPEAKVICHPKGIDHMIHPEKLWEGSLKVLGDIARAYGPIIPIAADRILFLEQLETDDGMISVHTTPGHAIHHLCYQFRDWLFAGEVAGVRHLSPSGIYARPATPPVFKLEVSLASLDKVIALKPQNLCLGHYGYVDQPALFLSEAREQLLLWVDTVKTEWAKGNEDVTGRIISALKSTDRLISGFESLELDIKQREVYFIGNSVKGMLHYIQNPA